MIYIPSFINIGTGIQKLFGQIHIQTHRHTYRQKGDLISQFFNFFENEESRLKARATLLEVVTQSFVLAAYECSVYSPYVTLTTPEQCVNSSHASRKVSISMDSTAWRILSLCSWKLFDGERNPGSCGWLCLHKPHKKLWFAILTLMLDALLVATSRTAYVDRLLKMDFSSYCCQQYNAGFCVLLLLLTINLWKCSVFLW
jgi:hypothetical protein